MAKSKDDIPPSPAWQKLAGSRIALAGEFHNRRALEKLVAVEGGTLENSPSAETLYLVIGGKGGNELLPAETTAEKLNQNGATIAALSESRFLGRLAPTDAELLKLLQSAGGAKWVQLYRQASADWVPSLAECDLTGANLEGADLSGFDLSQATLVRANLRHADLRSARLRQADLTDAHVEGARFDGADVVAARMSNAQIAAARGVSSTQVAGRGKIGPHLRQLSAMAIQARSFESHAKIQLSSEDVPVGVSFVCGQARGSHGPYHHFQGSSVPEVLVHLSNRYYEGALDVASIRVKITGGPITSRDAKPLAIAAWCEAFGIADPQDESLKAGKKSRRAEQQKFREEMLAELTRGAKGINRWNQRMSTLSKKQPLFRRAELPGVKLGGEMMARVDFRDLDLQESNFAGADLTNGDLSRCDLRGACLRAAVLTGADLHSGKYTDADFSKATLTSANLQYATFRRANFQGADLQGAKLCRSDLSGADFTGAKLKGTEFDGAKYDEATKWPANFKHQTGMIWKGKGDNPAIQKTITDRQSAGPIDMPTFLERLIQRVEQSKYTNAMKMLKADRFKLFAQVEPESVIGVVKSQTDPDLVYSCRLAADGKFACCTQNLNICGGLRGSLCKHLLVLIIGLANSGELDPTAVDIWIEASRLRKPELEKDKMSEAFLRYKGAEAGEVDWRPTETIPEDYYAL